MSNQSTPSRTPRASAHITRQRSIGASASGAPARPLGIYERFTGARSTITDLIENTAWTSNSSSAQESLLQTVNTMADIPGNIAQLSSREKAAAEDYILALEQVIQRLTVASAKYGRKDARKRDRVIYSWAHLDRTGGIHVLDACRTDIETAVKSFINHHEPRPTDAPRQNVRSNGRDGQVKDKSSLSTKLTIAQTTFNTVEAVSGAIPLVGTYIGAAAKVGSMIVDMWKGLDSNQEAAKSLEYRMSTLAEHLEYFKSRPQEHQNEQVNERIKNLQLQLKLVEEEIQGLKSKDAFSRAFLSRDNAETLKGFQEDIKSIQDEIHGLVILDTNALLNQLYIMSHGTEQNVKKLYDLMRDTDHNVKELYAAQMYADRPALLGRPGESDYGEQGHMVKEALCLEETRKEILHRIEEWIQDTSAGRVLWISGMAGRGKSTIAATIAHRCGSRSALGLFHFRRGQIALEGRLIYALAKQLKANGTPEIKHAILTAIQENDVLPKQLEKQFEVLLVNTLKHHPPGSPPVLLIVDALDECMDTDYATSFIRLIDDYSSTLPSNVKFVLTTRPEPPIFNLLRSKKWRTENLDQSKEINRDLEIFIRSECLKIREQDDSLSASWPSSDSIQKLVALSGGLFQWAKTAMTYIAGGAAMYRLKQVLDNSSTLKSLDDHNIKILDHAFEKATHINLLHRVLSILVAAPYPISLETLTYLLHDERLFHDATEVEAHQILRDEVFRNVKSLLTIPSEPSNQVQLMHTSIRDLLTDPKRCGAGSPYSIDLGQAHGRLTRDCFQWMEKDLKRNICNLSDLSMRNSDTYVQAQMTSKVTSGLQYCCRSWAAHLVTTNECEEHEGKLEISMMLETFSKTKLLCWLEVMSLIGQSGEAIQITKQVEDWIKQSPYNSKSGLVDLWSDANRFITEFFEPISFGALHIYASALAFCPIDTHLWKNYHDQKLTEVLQGQQKHYWSENVWTRHVDSVVETISISLSGNTLALGSGDGTIALWDAETGRELGQPLQGHTSMVTSLAFSPDGKRLASGSWDRTVCLWDVEKREQLGQPMQGHTKRDCHMTFSPDLKRLAMSPFDRTVQLWDVEKWEQLGQPMLGHTSGVTSMAFSPDGKRLASGSWDMTVCLWDVEKGEQLGQPMQGHTSRLTSVAFSPDGNRLASGSDDKTVCLWDVEKGEPIGKPMQGHTSEVNSVAFSPNGKSVASGSNNGTIHLWDVEKGKQLGKPMQGHTSWITSVAFSSDGKRLASSSFDKTVRWWDVEGEHFGKPMQGHTNRLASIAFSPDGKRLASGSEDGTVHLWDVEKGKQLGKPMQGHTNMVASVAFSPDGKRLASGGGNGAMHLWDVEKRKLLGKLMYGHVFWVTSIAFSPDGKWLASGSHDKTVRLWNVEKRKQFGKSMQGHIKDVTSVAFSPDGKRLVSGCWDGKVCLYDVEEWEQLGQPLQCHTTNITSVGFFSNTILSTRDDSNQLCWWSLPTIQPLHNPPKPINHRYCHQPPNESPFCSNGHWVTYTGSLMLWLPSQYLSATKRIFLSGSTLVVINDSISFLDISKILQFAPLHSPN